MTLTKPLECEPRAGKSTFFVQRFFRINGTARGKATAGPQKRCANRTVKTDHEDQKIFHAQAPAFLKRPTRSFSTTEKGGLACARRTFTKQLASGRRRAWCSRKISRTRRFQRFRPIAVGSVFRLTTIPIAGLFFGLACPLSSRVPTHK